MYKFAKVQIKCTTFQKLYKVGHYPKSDKSLSRKENGAKVIMACGYHKSTVIIPELIISVSVFSS